MSEEEYNFYSTHIYQLPLDIYKQYRDYVKENLRKVLSTLEDLSKDESRNHYCPSCISELFHILQVYIETNAEDADLDTSFIIDLDHVMTRNCKTYAYSSYLHGRVKKLYKTILQMGRDEWIKSRILIEWWW